jgi:allophanate hydrolase
VSSESSALHLDLPQLTAGYESGALTPTIVVETIFEAILARGDDAVWISLAGRDNALAHARELEALSVPERARRPLWGFPSA